MPLEDLEGPDKFLNALNRSWPLDDDPRPEGDNHVRGIKNVIVNTFGPLSGFVDVLRAVLYNDPAAGQPIKTGSVEMAVGTKAQRPAAPVNGDCRVVIDPDNSNRSCLEVFVSPEWRQHGLLSAQNQWSQDQYLIMPPAAGDPDAQIAKHIWGKTLSSNDQWGRLFVRAIQDTPTEEGQLTLGVRIAGVITEAVTVDSQNGAVFTAAVPRVRHDNVDLIGMRFESAAVSLVPNQVTEFAHGLPSRPKMYKAYLSNFVADAGYTLGDEVEIGTQCGTLDTQNNLDSAMSTMFLDNDTHIKFQPGKAIAVAHKTTGGFTRINMSSWQVLVRAWA